MAEAKLRTVDGDKDDPLTPYNRAEAAKYINCTPGTLRKWQWANKGPKPTKRGTTKQARVVYLKKHLDFYNQNPQVKWEDYP